MVYQVRRKIDKKIYVLKTIETRSMSLQQKREAALEATILSKINCEYVCRYYDSFSDSNSINIVMEFCENGDVGKFLKKQMGRSLGED